VAVAETRAGVPGPPGQDGKAGADGFGLEDFSVDFDGDRTIALKFERGSLKKSWAFALPFQKHQGVYQDGKSYVQGDVVTWAGSEWHCQTPTTTKPGDGSRDWLLVVKRGRDGKDGRDAIGAAPVVTVGSRS
jgi:integrin beta 3